MSAKDCVSFKVMMVEDDGRFRRSLAGLLLSRFPSIALDEAADGVEAMEKAKNFLPQLIFMDIKLPRGNGFDLTRRIKTLYPEIRVVILTTYDFPEYREAAHACGASHFLSKGSSTAEEIQDLVKELCAQWTPSGMRSAWYRNEDGSEINPS